MVRVLTIVLFSDNFVLHLETRWDMFFPSKCIIDNTCQGTRIILFGLDQQHITINSLLTKSSITFSSSTNVKTDSPVTADSSNLSIRYEHSTTRQL